MTDKASTHYFASNAFGWGVGDTREEAITNVIRNTDSTTAKKAIARLLKEGEPGLYCWSCKVLAPRAESYSIEFYQPKGVECEDVQHIHMLHVTSKRLAYWIRSANGSNLGSNIIEL